MEPQEPGNPPRRGPEVAERQRVGKERAAQTARSWTVQNQMRGVLGRMSTGAASLIEGCVRCSKDERKHSERDEKAQVPRWKSKNPVCRRISIRLYASSPRKEKSEYQRDYKRLQRGRVALPVWPAHQPRYSSEEMSVRGPIAA